MATSTRPTTPAQLRDAYRAVMDRIAAAAGRHGRRPSDVVCVAVTKTATPDQIRQVVEMGHADLGENRVQHLIQRVAQLEEFLNRRKTLAMVAPQRDSNPPATVRWHMIGHLQRNKVRPVLPLVKLIHSVDSLRLAEEIQTLAHRQEQPMDVLLQINTSGEESKFGVAPPAAIHLAEQIDSMVNLRLRGVMTIAPYTEQPETSRSVFARTAELFQDIKSAGIGGPTFNILSMGMSDDFEIAIEEGANVVRVGRAIFGESDEPEEPEAVRPEPGSD